jgi:hypothetical protein
MKTDAMLGRCAPAMARGLGLGPEFLNSDFGHDFGDVARIRTAAVALGSRLPYLHGFLDGFLVPDGDNFPERQRIKDDGTGTFWLGN